MNQESEANNQTTDVNSASQTQQSTSKNVSETHTAQPVLTRISVEYYMSKRVDEQIDYFNSKSTKAQKKYKSQKRYEFILALSIPVLVTFSTMEVAKKAIFFHVGDASVNLDLMIQITAAIAGIVMAYYNKVMDLEEYYKIWKDNRVNCEALEHERYSFLTRTGDYEIENLAFPKFVDKIESILNNDVQKWKQKTKIEEEPKDEDSDKKIANKEKNHKSDS